jgi:hypothetical protein
MPKSSSLIINQPTDPTQPPFPICMVPNITSQPPQSIQDHMREVQNKWNTLKLNDDIWAKLIYFEQNRRLAKAYVSTPVLTIDGSTNGLDGFRIGLSGIENSYRNLDSIACLRSIGQGIKLKIDQQGNILIRKLVPLLAGGTTASLAGGGQQQQPTPGCSVWVKEWPPKTVRHNNETLVERRLQSAGAVPPPPPPPPPPIASSLSSAGSDYSSSSPSQNSSSGSLELHCTPPDGAGCGGGVVASQDWRMQEIVDPGQSYKLFDMQKFRLQLDRVRRTGRNPVDGTSTLPIDWRQCVSIISFTRSRFGHHHHQSGSKLNRPEQQQILSDPCWLMLINIIAIDMLKSSVCDSRPSPSLQTSAMVNRYQAKNLNANRAPSASRSKSAVRQAQTNGQENGRDGLGASRQLSRLHAGQEADDYYGSASDYKQDFLAAAASSVVASARLQHRPARSRAPPLTGGREAELPPATDYVHSSERLKRLNNYRYQQQQQHQQPNLLLRQQQSSLSSKQLQPPSSGGQQGVKPRSPRPSQQEGSIYTTFTGKYLDKQHRLRAVDGRDSPPASSYLTSVENLGFGSSQVSAPSKQAIRRETRLGERRQHADRNLLYPMDSLAPKHGARWPNDRPSAGLQLPYSAHTRAIPAGKTTSQLTHSLSAFDLSHGLKLNLSSINPRSIKMNFDSDIEQHDDDGGGDDLDDDGHMDKEPGSHEDLVAKLKLKRDQLDTKHRQQQQHAHNARKTIQALNGEAREWANLAKKYSLSSSNNGSVELASSSGKSVESVGELSVLSSDTNDKKQLQEVEEQQEQTQKEEGDEGGESKMLHQNNMSRSSIASSSSSGCADNDYFISQSSNSSMSTSSSTRTSNEGGELSSQPASSSGIVCSENSSDGYERRSKLQNSDAADGADDDSSSLKLSDDKLDKTTAPPPTATTATTTTTKTKTSKTRQTTKSKTTDEKRQQPQQSGDQQQHKPETEAPDGSKQVAQQQHQHHRHHRHHQRLRPNHRAQTGSAQAISLSRGLNGKTIQAPPLDCHRRRDEDDDLLPPDDATCEACEYPCEPKQLQCDCGAPSCDRMLDSNELSISACDCFCDCLDQANVDEYDAQMLSPCQDELCDCGGPDEACGEHEFHPNEDGPVDDEPIYDHLPRFGRPSSRSQAKADGHTKPGTRSKLRSSWSSMRKSAADHLGPTAGEDYDRIVPMPMPNGGDSNLDKSKNLSVSSKDLNKRNSGWLESRKYIKLLPRFMFSSSSSSSSSAGRGASKQQAGDLLKAGTLERTNRTTSIFRRTRSSQNLTK